MSSIALSGDAAGAGVFTIAAPNSASSYTATLPAATTTLVGTDATQTLTNKTLTSPAIGGTPVMSASVITSGTAVASTSGTSIDFTSIPSWVKRITVMFNGVSTSGTSYHLFQLGSGSIQTTGYTSSTSLNLTTATAFTSTAGMISFCDNAAYVKYGTFVFTSFGSNTWIVTGGATNNVTTPFTTYTAGQVTLSGTLDRVRITTVNGTDTFDLGSINILYE